MKSCCKRLHYLQDTSGDAEGHNVSGCFEASQHFVRLNTGFSVLVPELYLTFSSSTRSSWWSPSVYGKPFDRTLDLNMVNLVPCSLHCPRTSCAPTSERDFGAIFDTTWPWSLMSVLCVGQPAITLGTLARLGGSLQGLLREAGPCLCDLAAGPKWGSSRWTYRGLNQQTAPGPEYGCTDGQPHSGRWIHCSCSYGFALAPCPAEDSVQDPPPGIYKAHTAWTRSNLPTARRPHPPGAFALSRAIGRWLAPGYISELLQSYLTSTNFEASHGRTQTVRAQSCDIMGRVCLQQGCPCVVEGASSLYQMCWLPELIQIFA